MQEGTHVQKAFHNRMGTCTSLHYTKLHPFASMCNVLHLLSAKASYCLANLSVHTMYMSHVRVAAAGARQPAERVV